MTSDQREMSEDKASQDEASEGKASETKASDILRTLFGTTVAAAQPATFMRGDLPAEPRGRTVVVGAGKAAAAMAAAFEAATIEAGWSTALSGVVVTRYGYAVPTRTIEVLEAAHPVPDEASVDAAKRVHAALRNLGPDDLVVALVSGGGSALLCAPAPGVSLADKQALNRALLKSGAPIEAMNTIRKHVSAIKGGRLARAARPARLVSLLMSDIPGDEMAAIASGPTLPDQTTLAMARDAVARRAIELPASIRAALDDPDNETPSADDPCFAKAEVRLVMTPGMALAGAAERARADGFEVVDLGSDLDGEASELGAAHARIAIEAARRGHRLCILSGGETVVTARSRDTRFGRGGRNTEYLLSLAIHLDGEPTVHAIAADTDGVDGSEDNAGALIFPSTLARARALGLDLRDSLARHDAYTAFEALGDLLVTGPTMTNVNDFRAILVLPK